MDPLILHNQVKAQKVKAMAPYCKHRFVQSMGKYLSLEFHLAVRLAGLCVTTGLNILIFLKTTNDCKQSIFSAKKTICYFPEIITT